MATQPSNQAVQEQQQQQRGLTVALAASMATAWTLIDLHDLAGSLPKYEAAVAALVFKFGQASAVLAQRFYRAERVSAGVPGTFTPRPADPAGIVQVQKSIGWATKGLWSPPDSSLPARTVEPAADSPAVNAAMAEANAKSLSNGAAQKMVVDAGRNTLIDAIEQDRHARGWARQARPVGCPFCAMLSTRGMVYRSEQTASFPSHTNCHCVPVPVFADHYEPPAYVRQWQQIYADSTRGKSGANARNAFRVALEAHRNPAPVAVSI